MAGLNSAGWPGGCVVGVAPSGAEQLQQSWSEASGDASSMNAAGSERIGSRAARRSRTTPSIGRSASASSTNRRRIACWKSHTSVRLSAPSPSMSTTGEPDEPPAADITGPWHTLDYTFVMEPGEAKLPRPPIQ